MLRDENDPAVDDPLIAAFVRLRHLARRKGLVIRRPDVLYLGDDELTLLSWIAAAQRIAVAHLRPTDRCLAAIITRCAALLEGAGFRLYPLTLYRHRLP